ncbi:MAG: PAS domain S-box protein [Candidatus Hydrogenedens sp.]|nr:PAS domain S-box protein [Candidatus Hydrogenedens sp.]
MSEKEVDQSGLAERRVVTNLQIRRLIIIQMVGIVLAALVETVGRIVFLNMGSSYYGVRVNCTLVAVSIWTSVSFYVIRRLQGRTWICRLVFAGTVLILFSLIQETVAYYTLVPDALSYFQAIQNIFQEGTFVAGLAAMLSGFYLALFESVRFNRLLQKEHASLQSEIEERRRIEEALQKSQDSLNRMNMELELRVEQRTEDLANANQRLQDEIEQRKSIAQSLISSEEKYRSLVQNANSIIIRWQQDGTITFLNSYGLQFFKYDEAEIIGKRVQDTLLSLSSENSMGDVVQGLFENPSRRLESIRQVVCKDGTTAWVSWMHSVSSDEISPDLEILSIGQDITSRKEMEIEREALREELLKIQKLDSIGRMASVFSHDFKNMLSIILMRVERASSQPGLPSDALFHLQAIQTAVGHSDDLIRELLTFACHEKAQPQILNMNKLVSDTVRMLQSFLTRGLKIHCEPGDDLPQVCLDKIQFKQIVTNITINAMDAMQGLGEVYITTEKVQIRDDSFLAGMKTTADEYVKISIRDTGPGIDPALESKVLDPFFTTKADGKGTGLGLWVVYGTVKQNHGFLDLRNRPGEGLELCMYFPACSETDPCVSCLESEEKIVEEKDKSLLIIESEAELLAWLSTLLLKNGYQVFTASSPEAAMKLVSSSETPIDLFVMNNLFPHKKAPELTDVLLEKHPQAKLLLMSTLGNICDPSLEKLPNTVEVIEKPFKTDEILRRINNLLEKE